MTVASTSIEAIKKQDGTLTYKATIRYSLLYVWNTTISEEFESESKAKEYLLSRLSGGKFEVKGRLDFDEAELVKKPSYSDVLTETLNEPTTPETHQQKPKKKRRKRKHIVVRRKL